MRWPPLPQGNQGREGLGGVRTGSGYCACATEENPKERQNGRVNLALDPVGDLVWAAILNECLCSPRSAWCAYLSGRSIVDSTMTDAVIV